jgi:hypothetical protein
MCEAEDELWELQRKVGKMEKELEELRGPTPTATIYDLIEDVHRGLRSFEELYEQVRIDRRNCVGVAA